MKTIRILLLISVSIISYFQSFAQQTIYFSDVQEDIKLGKELFDFGKYNAAFSQFDKIQHRVDEKSELYSEAEYYKSVSALKAGHSSGIELVENFTEKYPESPYINRAFLCIGDYQFEKQQFSAALQNFLNIDRTGFSLDEQIELHYKLGYSYMMMDNLEQAASEFYLIIDAEHFYSKPASYYWAHIMYASENYEAALNGFSKLNGDPVYSRFIPIYVSHIYYKQGRYNEVVNYTGTIINEVEEENRMELSKILGDSYFHINNYKEAIPYLEIYFNSPGMKPREDNYILGVSYYKNGNLEKAVPLLKNSSNGNDEMAQNAYYHLADSYIKLGDKENAKVAFGAASEFNFNERIKEDALFSYAKLTYELSYSPFNETINAFDRYISLYPNSERNTEAYRYLVDVYMITRNYSDAINSIEKIQNKTPDILRAYQRVTFFRGLELFNNQSYSQAINYFDLSLENGNYDRNLNARALFWKAETLYRTENFRNSITVYNQFLNTAGIYSIAEYQNADYNIAYAHFKLEQYDQAATHFRKYINANQGVKMAKLADAYNRVGDYYFLNNNYNNAIQNYSQSYNMRLFEPDYALLQIAFCQGLVRNQQEKISSLTNLLANFPESDYSDDALYELGRAYERLGQNDEALRQYQLIASDYSNGSFYSKALLQMGLINYNNADYTEALLHYKEVLEKYQGTEEAQTALLGIRNCYVETNNVEEYFSYTSKLGNAVSVTTSEQDELTYQSTERAYMAGNRGVADQLRRYIQQFPDGKYKLNAHFYLAEILYSEEKYNEANEHYTVVAIQPNNNFSEESLSKASELTFNAKQYNEALEMFKRLETIANSKWNILKAYIGQMRCYNLLNQPQNAIVVAEKIKEYDIASEQLINEADYIIGKYYYQSENFTLALVSLKAVASDTKTEQGAEAKFLISEIYYRQKNLSDAEKEIMDFVNKGTPYTYWLGKTFVLLSDIYLQNGRDFDAKHTLKSLIENYNNDIDGIKNEAIHKLNAIETVEKIEQEKAIQNSLQLK
ncbi:MAG: tetratricopeptide repeat protein [Bacteroidales bacterium]|jgi:TolA-binding protein|nr:tetratricopeptide repeat protein [Bacteroidales bacterium]